MSGNALGSFGFHHTLRLSTISATSNTNLYCDPNYQKKQFCWAPTALDSILFYQQTWVPCEPKCLWYLRARTHGVGIRFNLNFRPEYDWKCTADDSIISPYVIVENSTCIVITRKLTDSWSSNSIHALLPVLIKLIFFSYLKLLKLNRRMAYRRSRSDTS